MAGLIIGLTLFALHFPFINVMGLSVNPARGLGPAVFVAGKALAQIWLFLVIPMLAGAAAGWVFASPRSSRGGGSYEREPRGIRGRCSSGGADARTGLP